MERVILIDGRNFVYRNHYTHRTLFTTEGECTSVLYGCLNGLLTLSKKMPESQIVIVWDGGGETWRHRLLKPEALSVKKDRTAVKWKESWFDRQVGSSLNYLQGGRMSPQERIDVANKKLEGYKAHREQDVKAQEQRASAVEQIPELIRITNLIGLKNFKIEGLEGDDLIGILAKAILKNKFYDEVIIHSTDNDFCQLLKYEGIAILKGIDANGDMRWVNDAAIEVEHGITIDQWPAYRALVGDKTDNIPQVQSGLGPVKCRNLLKQGFDASLGPDSEAVPERAWQSFSTVCKKIVDRKEVWQKVRKSYLASKIVMIPDFSLFSEEVKNKTVKLVSGLDKSSFCRTPYTEDGYRELKDWLIEKEMNYLRSRIAEFTTICTATKTSV